jgi:hypothetical protein
MTTGCTTTLIPPPHPNNPTTVFLTDYGKHSSLLLPDPTGGFEEYSFGDWAYFALGRKNALVMIAAIIHSPKSTLGRRYVDANESIGAERTQSLIVDQTRVTALRQTLDSEFARHADTEVFNAQEHLYFVHSDQPYNLFHNCNNVTAEWLKKLGVEVRGFALTSEFKIEPASPPTTHT